MHRGTLLASQYPLYMSPLSLPHRHYILPTLASLLILVASFILLHFYLGEMIERSLNEEITWVLGLTIVNSALILMVMYSSQNTALFQQLLFEPKLALGKNKTLRLILFVFSFYLLTMFLQWLVFAREDETLQDHSFLVVLFAGLLLGWRVVVPMAIAVIFIRSLLLIWLSAEGEIATVLNQTPWQLFNPIVWVDESWVWLTPENTALVVSALTGLFAYYFSSRSKGINYPIWIGVPLAYIIELSYISTAWFRWSEDNFTEFIANEAFGSVLGMILGCFIFILIINSARLKRIREDIAKAELVAAQAQIRFLQAQIKPHFLFNSLNVISSLIQQKPQEAKQLILELSQVFRHITCHSDDIQSTDLVCLEQELSYVKSYINLEKARLGEQLNVAWHISPHCLQSKVPALILQPLVENAIKHGITPLESGGLVSICASYQDNRLLLTVTDNGNGLMSQPMVSNTSGSGVALQNIKDRLQLFYGDYYTLTMDSKWGEGTEAILDLPQINDKNDE